MNYLQYNTQERKKQPALCAAPIHESTPMDANLAKRKVAHGAAPQYACIPAHIVDVRPDCPWAMALSIRNLPFFLDKVHIIGTARTPWQSRNPSFRWVNEL